MVPLTDKLVGGNLSASVSRVKFLSLCLPCPSERASVLEKQQRVREKRPVLQLLFEKKQGYLCSECTLWPLPMGTLGNQIQFMLLLLDVP